MSNDWRAVLTTAERNELAKIETELSQVIETIRNAKRKIYKLTKCGPPHLRERREQFAEIVELKQLLPRWQEERTFLQSNRYRIQNRASKRSSLTSRQSREEIAA